MSYNIQKKKVLFVDDEIFILESVKRDLVDYYDIVTAKSAVEGLKMLYQDPSIIVVISDMRMPGMDGISFLSEVKNKFPDVIKVMLTGNMDVDVAIKAVNYGNIFRFIQKPCKSNELIQVINSCFQQYDLKNSEKILLETTLDATVKVMIEMLSLASPVIFGKIEKIKEICELLSKHLGLKDLWIINTAAMLSQIGLITLPDELITKINNGGFLSKTEEKVYKKHSQAAYDLLVQIPRLELVAKIILNQNEKFESNSCDISDEKAYISCSAAILKIAIDYERIHARGLEHIDIIEEMRQKETLYNVHLLNVLRDEYDELSFVKKVYRVSVRDLTNNMIIEENIKSANGVLIIKKGVMVTEPLKCKLMNQMLHYGLKGDILISERSNN